MVHAPSIYQVFEHAVPAIAQAIAVAALLTLLVAWRVGASVGAEGLVPDARFSLRNGIEIIFEYICRLAEDSIGHDWKRYMPLIGTLGLFILIGNLLNIVPGLGAPTGFIETNLAWAIVCVLTSEIASIRVHGVGGWLQHLAPGPWWLAPLIFPIELFSHLIRFFSLTIRLTANMFADHTLLSVFLSGLGLASAVGYAISVIFPWIVLGLGLFVCFVQAFIFTFLTILYIGMGTEEAH
jgi:F-type H+-transporting ATPase subunit a